MSVVLGLLFGIINTLVLHLSKAMERHGIEIFSRKKSFKEKGKKPLIYIIGFILNNTVFIWQIIGISFARAAVFSSVFGLGLILLMIVNYLIDKKIFMRGFEQGDLKFLKINFIVYLIFTVLVLIALPFLLKLERLGIGIILFCI